jgi:release factor glutamine methyltransferase
MNIGELLQLGANELKGIVDRPRFESELLLQSILKKERLYILINQSEPIPEFAEDIFREHLQRRRRGEPIEYILQIVGFYSREFYIDRGALIPRPETEILIDKCLEVLKDIPNPKVVEIGVGSGIISTMLATLRSDLSSLALDISPEALKIAKINIEDFNVSDRVELRESDLFSSVRDDEVFDMIISNPPYISDSEKGKLQRELDFEPDNALYGGENGDELLHQIIDLFFKRDEKYLLCEMGYDQRDSIKNYVAGRGSLEFYQDLAGHDRGFILSKSSTLLIDS